MRYADVALIGVWRSLVARFVRDEEVVGSNPATPTSKTRLSREIPSALSSRNQIVDPIHPQYLRINSRNVRTAVSTASATALLSSHPRPGANAAIHLLD